MMGSDSIDCSVEALWRCWRRFIQGKRQSRDLMVFRYSIEHELRCLSRDLTHGTYRHGSYRTFTVCDPKERTISVASVRDRLVHRLLYDYLVNIFDRQFIFDVWSARKEKGLTGALDRLRYFTAKYRDGFFWRADIHRFFDHIDHAVLYALLQRRVPCGRVFSLLREVINSFPDSGIERERESCRTF